MRKMSVASVSLSSCDSKTTENYRGIGAMGGVGRTTGVGSSGEEGEEEEEEQDEDEEDEERGVGETALAVVSTSIAGTLDDSTLSSKPGWNRHPQQQQEQYLRQHKRLHGWRRQSKRDYTKRNEACGMCGCKPRWMQIFNNPRALLFFLCSGSFIQGFVLNGLNSVNATSLERRFGLNSSNIGMIASVYDISAALFGVLISYLCSRGHKPRWLGVSIIIMGLGSLIMSLPHFTTDLYKMGQEIVVDQSLCSVAGNSSSCSSVTNGQRLSWYMYIFLLGQILNGVGGATLYTVGFACIDDNVSHKRSPVYISILLCLTMVGVAVGYTAGGKLLDFHVDFLHIDSSRINTDPKNPRWVGAWWVGYLAGGLIALVMGPFLLCYPKRLPQSEKAHYDDDVMKQLRTEDDCQYKKTERGKEYQVTGAMCNLFQNPTFLMVTLSAIAESINVAGIATFLPKFIQNHFHQTPSWASMLAGVVVVPAGAAGQLLGGYLSRRLQLHVKGMARMCIITLALSSAGVAAFWVRCESGPMAGINANYHNGSYRSYSLVNLTSKCNEPCHCTTEIYEPVCNDDGIQYFSPCHAGCKENSRHGNVYSDCACVESLPVNGKGGDAGSRTVSRGSCLHDCMQLFIFLPATFLSVFFSFIAQTPLVSMVLRCTEEDQRSFALGLNAFVVRMLGSLPGPLLIGAIIDHACSVWQTTCEGDSSCWIYNDMSLAANLIILILALRLVSIVSLLLADRTYKSTSNSYPQKNEENQLNPTNEIYTESLVIPKRYSVNILESQDSNYNPVGV